MSKIRIMPENLSNKIAAGEVVERPASVVKELVENAIDAGASAIKIEIARAGTKLISVSDNGCGMDSDDVLLSLEMHGTNKIFSEDDIEKGISSMGFRGEALPSIGSISKLTIRSRRIEDLEGTMLKVSGGKFSDSTPVGCSPGTTVKVEDLFFNIPARKKFLKSNATEEQHIQEMLIQLALPHPQISFTYISDGRVIFNSPAAGGIEQRIRTFFGKNFAEEMLKIDYQSGNIKIYGFIGCPGFTKSSRKEQKTFVNLRPVESFAIYRGIKEGYSTIAEKGRYAPCILFLELPASDVDVNVHPAKREVRFKHEFVISSVVSEAVRNSLKVDASRLDSPALTEFKNLNPKASLSSVLSDAYKIYTPKNAPELPNLETVPAPEPTYHPSEDISDMSNNLITDYRPETPKIEQAEFANHKPENPEVPEILPDENETINFTPKSSPDFPQSVLGILDNSYLLCSGVNGLIIVDQHAAHERILFEKLLRAKQQPSDSQILLLPQVIELPINYTTLLLRNLKTFEKLGFDISHLGSNTVMLNALPNVISSGNLESLLQDMLSELVESGNTKGTAPLEIVARSACKAAIKFHDKIDIDGAKQLLEQLSYCDQPTLCPHGRPIMIDLSYKELRKRFMR